MEVRSEVSLKWRRIAGQEGRLLEVVLVVLVAKSCLTLATPWTVACQAPLSVGFSRQEYWSGLPFPSCKLGL